MNIVLVAGGHVDPEARDDVGLAQPIGDERLARRRVEDLDDILVEEAIGTDDGGTSGRGVGPSSWM